MGRVDLKSMPVVTVEQVARFREAAIAENSALLELVRVQHEALEYAANQVSELRDVPGYAAALAKYNEVMGANNDQ